MNDKTSGPARARDCPVAPPHAGTEKPLRVTAGVLIRDGQVMIARRAPGQRLAGKWEFPGGKIEPGETPEQCLRRELDEELQLDATVHELLGAAVYDYGAGPFELMAYRVSGDTDSIVMRDHDAVAWMAIGRRGDYDLAEADWFILDILEKGVGTNQTHEHYSRQDGANIINGRNHQCRKQR